MTTGDKYLQFYQRIKEHVVEEDISFLNEPPDEEFIKELENFKEEHGQTESYNIENITHKMAIIKPENEYSHQLWQIELNRLYHRATKYQVVDYAIKLFTSIITLKEKQILLPGHIEDWFQGALNKLNERASDNKVSTFLGIKPKPGTQRNIQVEIDIASFVYLSTLPRDLTINGVYHAVSEVFPGISPEKAQKVYERMYDDWLKGINSSCTKSGVEPEIDPFTSFP